MNAAPIEPAPNESSLLAKREVLSALRAAISSFVATLTDGAFYQLVVLTTMRMGPHSYAAAAVAGAVAGGVTNFTLNRRWAFRANGHPLLSQGARYAVGSFLTLVVLEATLWIIVDKLGFDARAAWFPAKFVTWVAFSYPFQRFVVFTGGAR
jgi:putative flippase GtrA